MKKQTIIDRYNMMIASYEKKKIDLTNRVNCYTCTVCGHITKTRDIHKGIAPYLHSCEKCNGISHSSFYNDIAPKKNPTQEWFRPSLKEILKFYIKNPAMLEYILSGGLDNRKISING
jgi:hypothetical protein